MAYLFEALNQLFRNFTNKKQELYKKYASCVMPEHPMLVHQVVSPKLVPQRANSNKIRSAKVEQSAWIGLSKMVINLSSGLEITNVCWV